VTTTPESVPMRTVGEWAFNAQNVYYAPYADVALDAVFTSPSGRVLVMPAFFDGDNTWRVRFSPDEPGKWRYETRVRLPDAGLEHRGEFTVSPNESRGFVRATPDVGWGFSFDNGEPILIFGDTTYHLFAMAYCGLDVASFLKRRVDQGFNLLRIRVPVSPFHRPEGYSHWETRRTWPWGGSEQAPRFDQINLDYFRTVDEVVRQASELGIGIEMIMEGWGFEFPFNSRQIFLPEWEELWLRYLIARYDAFPSTWFWTPLNEYEYYPNGDWNYKSDGSSDRWQMRIARWIKAHAPHGHPVAAHNGPRLPPFAERFAIDPGAVDLIMYQEWGSRGQDDGWLAAGIEELIDESFEGWKGSKVFAEWGYERNPEFDLNVPHHEFCDAEHTRRGAWRGAFRAMGIIHGFENSWGPWAKLDTDQPGVEYLLHWRRFFLEVLPFVNLRPAPELLSGGKETIGERPQALATADRSAIAVYFPVGGDVTVQSNGSYLARWFNPRTGELGEARVEAANGGMRFVTPDLEADPRADWVLVLTEGSDA
jgi:hypothetical protein